MRKSHFLFLIMLILASALEAEPPSTEEFEKMDQRDQNKAYEQATPEQKIAFEKIWWHLALIRNYGEEGLKKEKEARVAGKRGLGSLFGVFNIQVQMWGYYVANIISENGKMGMARERQAEVEMKLTKEEDALIKRSDTVLSLAFNMAASPEALALAERAEDLEKRMSERELSRTLTHPITKEEVTELTRQMDQMFEQMKKLPTLPPEQVQKEINAFPEEEIQAGIK